MAIFHGFVYKECLQLDYENWTWYSDDSHVHRKERVAVPIRYKPCESVQSSYGCPNQAKICKPLGIQASM